MKNWRPLSLMAIIFIGCTIALWACGSDETSEENDENEGLNLQNVEDEVDRYEAFDDAELRHVLIAEAVCEVAWGCSEEKYDSVFSASHARGLSSKAECIELFTEFELRERPTPEERLAYEQGRITVDREALLDCREKFLTQYCSEGFDDDFHSGHPCPEAFSGEVAEGGLCYLAHECQGSLVCDHSDDTGVGADACYGVCVEEDDPYSYCGDEDCGSDEYCDLSDQEAFRCRPLLSEGESCQSQRCEHGTWCSAEEVCTSIEITNEGQSCQWGQNFCEAGTICFEEDSSATQGQCREAGRDGDECNENYHCAFPFTCLSDDDGQQACGLGAIGDPCTWNPSCAEGRCLPGGPDSQCSVPGQNGDPCAWFGECESNYCDPSTMECADYDVCEVP